MPELPELDVLAENLAARLAGARVAAVRVVSVAALKTFEPPIDALVGLAVTGAGRRAKYVWLELGELRLVSGDPAPAFSLAERALMLEPFDGRGHRLLLAAALRSHHPVDAARARRMVCSALRELGVAPDPATALLLRQLAPKQRPDQQARALHG